LSIPNTESITVSHRDIDTQAVPHQDVDIQAVHDATFHPACRFVADHRNITECYDQRIAYGDLNSKSVDRNMLYADGAFKLANVGGPDGLKRP